MKGWMLKKMILKQEVTNQQMNEVVAEEEAEVAEEVLGVLK